MTSKQQILEIEPSTELRFMGPFSTVVSTELVLSNPTSDRVLFKIKTTAPRRYCVRPNSGHIGPKDKAIITIMLQPQDFDPAAEKNKHKFMVQSCIAPQDFAGEASMDQVWKDTPSDRISDTRLKCTFVEESGSLSIGSGTNKSITSQSSVTTLASARDGERDGTSGRSRAAPEVQEDSKVGSQSAEPKSPPSAAPAPAPAPAPASDGAGSQQLVVENERLRQQLVDLQAEHTQLRQAEQRLRNVAAQSSVDHATSTQPQRAVQPGGPPTNLYAIIAIVALLIGLLLGRFVL